MQTYLETTRNVYKEAAENPQVGLCCTTTPVWQLPGLKIPKKMLDMNYGCGSTVNPRDLVNEPSILYVGVGGGMELLQFSYFSRRKGGVVGIDVVDEMLQASRENFVEAEKQNTWFKSEFVDLRKGDALSLPVPQQASRGFRWRATVRPRCAVCPPSSASPPISIPDWRPTRFGCPADWER